VYLQKAKDAKRVYATAVSARSNTEGFRLEGPIYPTNNQQIELFRESLDIAKISPADVDYIESSACGDPVPLIVLIRIQYIPYSLHLVSRNKNFIPPPKKNYSQLNYIIELDFSKFDLNVVTVTCIPM